MQQARRYEVHELIGRGGMGEVYRGTALGPHGFAKPVAIKRLRRELARSAWFVDRLVQEAKLLVALQHSNLVSVLDLGRAKDDVFMALEYVDGPDLGTLLGKGPLPAELSVYVVRAACEGVAFAHEQRQGAVVHADLSPGNVLISRAGEVKVTDFGIARREGGQGGSGSVEGKWPYMSPEQVRGEALTTRSDVFSMGVVLYEAASGRRPFLGEDKETVIQAIIEQEPLDLREVCPDTPVALAEVCARSLAKNPGQRFASIRELGAALDEVSYTLGWRAGPAELAAHVARQAPAPLQRGASVKVVLSDLGIGAADGRATVRAKGGRRPESALLTGTVISRGSASLGLSRWQLPSPRSAWRRYVVVMAAALTLGGMGLLWWANSSRSGDAGALGGQMVAHDASPEASSDGGDARATMALQPDSASVADGGSDGLVARAPGHRAVRQNRRRAQARATAARRNRSGVLRVHAEPWGYVEVDGKKTRKATPSVHRLPAGTHRVRVYSPSTGLGRTMVVTVREGKTKTISLRLENR